MHCGHLSVTGYHYGAGFLTHSGGCIMEASCYIIVTCVVHCPQARHLGGWLHIACIQGMVTVSRKFIADRKLVALLCLHEYLHVSSKISSLIACGNTTTENMGLCREHGVMFTFLSTILCMPDCSRLPHVHATEKLGHFMHHMQVQL